MHSPSVHLDSNKDQRHYKVRLSEHEKGHYVLPSANVCCSPGGVIYVLSSGEEGAESQASMTDANVTGECRDSVTVVWASEAVLSSANVCCSPRGVIYV